MAAAKEGKKIGQLRYVFVTDEIILDLNRQYLQHDDYTDIITFDDSAQDVVSGEMYVSVDTVRSNSVLYQTEFRNELLRVMLHGMLHLCGYRDATVDEQNEMRAAEDRHLETFQF